MKFKKWISLLACALLIAGCVSLTACNDSPAETVPSTPETETTTEAPETTTEATEPTETEPEATEPTEPEASEPETPDTSEPETPDTSEPETPDASDPEPPSVPQGDGSGDAIAATAKSLEGKAYAYGAAGPDSFDNSGLVYYCLKQNGIDAPRRTLDLAQAGTEVAQSDLAPGDVVFFYNDVPGTAQYAGIYLGDNQFIAADNEEKPITIHDLSLPYFQNTYVTARRITG